VESGEAEVAETFCAFLARQGYVADADAIRDMPPDRACEALVSILYAVGQGKVVFDP